MATQRIPAIVEAELAQIVSICQEFGVQRLEVFGSAALAESLGAESDIDFLVEYPSGFSFGPFGERHFALRDRLSALLGRPVDLVVLRNIRNPFVLESIEASRHLLYAA